MLLNEEEKKVKSVLEKLKEIGVKANVSSIKFHTRRKRPTRFYVTVNKSNVLVFSTYEFVVYSDMERYASFLSSSVKVNGRTIGFTEIKIRDGTKEESHQINAYSRIVPAPTFEPFDSRDIVRIRVVMSSPFRKP
ncbi:hypothetical protein [Stygiolobus caldivivus]|uniref:hypothetical protein n=1 Tax=Stygiolobus caldivivus TaxID=2824673 RepID=UPI001C864DEE|nr:hypothetical protein [Stygiolobus caldivivus]